MASKDRKETNGEVVQVKSFDEPFEEYSNEDLLTSVPSDLNYNPNNTDDEYEIEQSTTTVSRSRASSRSSVQHSRPRAGSVTSQLSFSLIRSKVSDILGMKKAKTPIEQLTEQNRKLIQELGNIRRSNERLSTENNVYKKTMENTKKEKDHMQKEYEVLKSKTIELENAFKHQDVEKTQLKTQLDKLNETLIFIQQNMNVYQKKLEDANVPQFTSIHNAANVQMETGTTIMNKVYIENINDDLNTLLLSYLRQLEKTREEYQRASEKLEDFQERCYEFELKQKEFMECLVEMKTESTHLKQQVEIDYTLRLVDPKGMMEECIQAITGLPKDQAYRFDELLRPAQLGVLRILKKKYGKRTILKELSFSIGNKTTAVVDETAHEPLSRDECTAVLVAWVHHSSDHNADKLMRIFPRIKDYRLLPNKPGLSASVESLYFNSSRQSSDLMREDMKTVLEVCNDIPRQISTALNDERIEKVIRKILLDQQR